MSAKSMIYCIDFVRPSSSSSGTKGFESNAMFSTSSLVTIKTVLFKENRASHIIYNSPFEFEYMTANAVFILI